MGLVFGEVDATIKPDLAFPPAREQVILHDHAGTGFPSWDVLVNGGAPAGIVTFNGLGLELTSPDVAANAPNGQMFGAAALNRFTRPAGHTKVYIVWDWKYRVFRSSTGTFTFTKGPQFGLDTSDWGTTGSGAGGIGGLEPVSGNRTLCMARCLMYDEGEGVYYGGKWQMPSGEAGAPSMTDLRDIGGQLIAPSTPGYERLLVGMNYGKWLRQRTEQVFDLTAVTVAATPAAVSVSNGSTAATVAGGVTLIRGAHIAGTSVVPGTWVTSSAPGTAVLSQPAIATTNTLAGATYSGAVYTARLEGLRHNGCGFGSLAAGPTGYDPNIGSNSRARELLDQQATPSGAGIGMPAISQDAAFQGGMNVYAQIDNRSNQPSKSKLLVTRCRVGVFS